MPEQTAYKELLRDYRQLQLRVTQFSRVEQQLIDTKDRLDQELLIYKRMSEFSALALSGTDLQGFLDTVAESVVGIFELESAFILAGPKQEDGQVDWLVGCEGMAVGPATLQETLSDLVLIDRGTLEEPVDLTPQEGLAVLGTQALMLHAHASTDRLEMWLCGFISKQSLPLYPKVESRHQTIFSVFAHQVRTHVANLAQAEELSRKNAELQKSNAELDQFAYSVSHDLRSPLLAIKGMIHLIQETEQTSVKVTKYLQLADGSIERLDKNIQEILEYSRSTRREVQCEPTDVASMVTDIFEDLQFSHEGEVQFSLTGPASLEVHTDPLRLSTVLKNVIGNAVKYRDPAAEPSWVKVDLRSDDGQLHIQVSDNGMGISSVALDHVFDMFYRGTTKSLGMGLGLYFCANAVEKLGGAIGVESEEGKGATFTIHLPHATPLLP